MYYVYMLRCRGGVFYTGLAVDVVRRFRTHVAGKGAKFTRACPPEVIAAVWRCGDKVTAARLEYAIKKHLSHQQKQGLAAPGGGMGRDGGKRRNFPSKRTIKLGSALCKALNLLEFPEKT